MPATDNFYEFVQNKAEDFLKMESGGRYILSNDITLEKYVPLDVDLVEFDGNGRTITIKSFGIFEETSIKAGLFKQVYENMIVKNVVVNYETDDQGTGDWSFGKVGDQIIYSDICNSKENFVN